MRILIKKLRLPKRAKLVVIAGFTLTFVVLQYATKAATSCANQNAQFGSATFTNLQVAAAGTYIVNVRTLPTAATDTIGVQIDDGECIFMGNSMNPNTWSWLNWTTAGTSAKAKVTLSQGTHKITVHSYANNLQIDRILLLDERSTCLPSNNRSAGEPGDNCLSYTPPPPPPSPQPDLVVTNITTAPSSPKTTDTVTFSATIKNQGTAATAATVHRVSFAVNGTAVAWSDTYTSSLAAGASVTVSTSSGNWKPTSASTYNITAFVDDGNKITNELIEANNTLTKQVIVQTPQPVTPPTPVIPPTPPAAPKEVSFSIKDTAQTTTFSSGQLVNNVRTTTGNIKLVPVVGANQTIEFTATINGQTAPVTNGTVTTPNANGVYQIAVTAKDTSTGASSTQTVSIRVACPDINRNNKIDIVDAIAIFSKRGSTTQQDLDKLDLDGNKAITFTDVVIAWGARQQ